MYLSPLTFGLTSGHCYFCLPAFPTLNEKYMYEGILWMNAAVTLEMSLKIKSLWLFYTRLLVLFQQIRWFDDNASSERDDVIQNCQLDCYYKCDETQNLILFQQFHSKQHDTRLYKQVVDASTSSFVQKWKYVVEPQWFSPTSGTSHWGCQLLHWANCQHVQQYFALPVSSTGKGPS